MLPISECKEETLISRCELPIIDLAHIGVVKTLQSTQNGKSILKSKEIKDIFQKEAAEVYYTPYVAPTARTIARNASGKLLRYVYNRRRVLRDRGIIAPSTRSSSSRPSASSIEVLTPTDPEEVSEKLTFLRNSIEPWTLVELNWRETASCRLRTVSTGGGSLEAYFTQFPALKRPCGYTLLMLDFNYLFPHHEEKLFNNLVLLREKIFELARKKIKVIKDRDLRTSIQGYLDFSTGEETCSMRSVIKRVGAQLHKAFSEKGLAILVNHGIADEKLKEVYADLDSFCALPDNTTEQFLCNPDTNHGYVKPGMEKLEKGKMELRHAFNITSLSHEDLPNSSLVPDFADHAAHLAHDFTALSRLVLRALSVALQLPSAWLEERHGGMFLGNNASTLRLLLYPPVPPQDDEKAEDVIRCGAHADYGTFTLLAQDSDGGLEVQLAGRNEWQAVGHLPGAILVQPGELLSAWSNGLYPALRHRVVVPRSVYARARKRHAVAYFCHPDNDAVAPPIPPLLLLPAPVPIAAPTRHTFQDRLAGAVHLVHKRFRETYA